MTQSQTERSFAVPVSFLLAGVPLGFLSIMWFVLGTGPMMDDLAPVGEAPSRPWLPIGAALLSIAALWWGIRALRQPLP